MNFSESVVVQAVCGSVTSSAGDVVSGRFVVTCSGVLCDAFGALGAFSCTGVLMQGSIEAILGAFCGICPKGVAHRK